MKKNPKKSKFNPQAQRTRKYSRGAKCSVGPIGGTQRPSGPMPRRFETTIKASFERGPAKKSSEKGKERSAEKTSLKGQARAMDLTRRACRKWTDTLLHIGIKQTRRNFVEQVKTYIAPGTRNAFNSPDNYEKNRYNDIALLDKTRIKIKTSLDGDDYIHASLVEVCPEMSIICAQGPLENTVPQFLTMIVEYKCKVILQLCQNFELNREKSSEYFPPPEEGDQKEYGPVKVTVISRNVNVKDLKDVARTQLEITFNNVIFETTHILYSGWPDHVVPDDLQTYMGLRALVHRLYNKTPIVVHCSAGIGRSGSFAAIEIGLYQLKVKHNNHLNMVELARNLRNQRERAIQSDLQFLFVHRMILEDIEKNKLIEVSPELTSFCSEYEKLAIRKKQEVLQQEMRDKQ